MYVLPGKPCVFCSFWQLRLKMTLCLGPLRAGMGSGVSECVDVPCTCVLKMILAHVVQLDTRKFWQMRRRQKIQKEVLWSCRQMFYLLAVLRCIMATKMHSMQMALSTGTIQKCCVCRGNGAIFKPLRLLCFAFQLNTPRIFMQNAGERTCWHIIQFEQSVKPHAENLPLMYMQMHLIQTCWHYTDTILIYIIHYYTANGIMNTPRFNKPSHMTWLDDDSPRIDDDWITGPSSPCTSISVSSWHRALVANFQPLAEPHYPQAMAQFIGCLSRGSGPMMSHVHWLGRSPSTEVLTSARAHSPGCGISVQCGEWDYLNKTCCETA